MNIDKTFDSMGEFTAYLREGSPAWPVERCDTLDGDNGDWYGHVTYDLARLMKREGREDVNEVSCSGFGEAIIERM